MLKAWLLQQEQQGDATVRQQVSDARERLEGDRKQWVGDVMGSISKLADLNAAFFRSPLPWSSGDPASSIYHNARKDAAANRPETQDAERKKKLAEGGRKLESTENGARAASSWVGILGRHDRDNALPLTQEAHGGAGGASGAAALLQPRGTAEGGIGHGTHPQPAAETAAAKIEARAAEKRCARLEALSSLARQGLAAHWRAFFRDEIDRTRMAATALDMTASGWAQRQREAVGVLRTSWRGRDRDSTATSGGVGGGSDDSDRLSVAGVSVARSGGEEDSVVRGAGTASTSPDAARTTSPAVQAGNAAVEGAETVTTTHLSTQAGGLEEVLPGISADTNTGRNAAAAARETAAPVKGRSMGACEHEAAPSGVVKCEGEGDHRKHGSVPTATEPEENAADTRRSGGDGGDDDSACVIVVRDVGTCNSGGLQVVPSDVEAAEAASQLVVFVGRAMAFHTSTIRSSNLEKFHEEERRRRCSSFSAPPQQGQHERRYRWFRAYPMHQKAYRKKQITGLKTGCLSMLILRSGDCLLFQQFQFNAAHILDLGLANTPVYWFPPAC